ncbi:MAG: hypothetical protein KGL99_14570 [Burkholderiales bacterium]|nr:hypothetical protein [Burkholderiales bacterium]
MSLFIALLSGLIFGLGLIAGGMTNPAKVQAFLDLFGSWDPSLAFVMAGGISVGVFGFAAARKRKRALSGDPIDLPTAGVIDTRLIVGGALFGVGWGIGGFCPGPAVTALGAGFLPAVWFVAAMLAGMGLHDRYLSTLFASRERRL